MKNFDKAFNGGGERNSGLISDFTKRAARLAAAVVVLGLSGGAAHAFTYEPCTETEVTFGATMATQSPADACFDWSSQFGNPDVELGMVTAGFGEDSDNPWTFLAKAESGGNTDSGTFADVAFTVTSQNTSSGTWTLSWEDLTGTALPSTFDFGVVIKAARGTGGFLFDDYVIPIDPTTGIGTFEVGVITPGGNPAGLSHLSLFVRHGDGDTPPPPPGTSVPLPGTALLFMAGLVGYRRFRS